MFFLLGCVSSHVLNWKLVASLTPSLPSNRQPTQLAATGVLPTVSNLSVRTGMFLHPLLAFFIKQIEYPPDAFLLFDYQSLGNNQLTR